MVLVHTFRTYVETKDGLIHCRVSQPTEPLHTAKIRPPLLCLHMSPKSGWVYEPLLERVGSDRLVVAPDTPGFGMSDRPSNPPDIAMYADVLVGITAKFAPDAQWDLLGYHTGSQIAVEAALRHPSRVRRLVLISAPVLTAAERSEFQKLGLGSPRVWDEAGDSLLSLWRLVLRWRTAGSDLGDCARSLADTLIAGEMGWWGHEAAFRHDMESALKHTRHPMAILNLGDDLYEATRRAKLLRPDADYVEMLNWAHGFIQKFPDEAAALIGALLDASLACGT